ncbi:site-2 protease family protein [Candidatus Lokiarchaeum ossiferum]|uniref:site-2 protease family protein n=1 Tax=Candidatus Lokiarchaeum ossiferum TaxID=2951803 RepID=UPI00352FA5C9
MGFDILGFIVEVIRNPLFIISIVFWAIAFVLVKFLGKKKENASIFFPFLALFRFRFFNKLFKKIAQKNRKLWRAWWNIGVIVSFLLMCYALYFFVSNFFHLIIDPQPENAIMPLIPGVTISLPQFQVLILPILLTMTVHEFSHAIAAENDDVNVKSAGIMGAGLFFIILYGAFVEVDEFQLYSRTFSSKTRLRVAAAGVWTNVVWAGLAFLLISSFPQIMNLSYESASFQVTAVVPAQMGGFNEENLEVGDIVYKINGTTVDSNNAASLTDILSNRTALQVSAEDVLLLTCYNAENRSFYDKEVVLGFRPFIGFDYQFYNNTAINITSINPSLNGGNNEGLIPVNTIITKIGNNTLNNASGITLENILIQKKPNYKLNLTSNTNEIYEINVNYFPAAPGAHVFHDIYTGLNLSKVDNFSLNVTNVFKNVTESGNNEGNIPEKVIIKKINGISLNLTEYSFKEFVKTFINPEVGDILIFTDNEGQNYSINTSEIPVIPVFIGLTSETYWIPKNGIGRLFGGLFPIELYTFLYYTFLIMFSLAIFNLLPTTIFDGGRLVKEIINLIFGTKDYNLNARKRLHYEYSEKDQRQHLMTQGIHHVIGVRELIPLNDEENKKDINLEDESTFELRELEYQPHDTSTDGFIDTIEIKSYKDLKNKSLIEVEIEYEQDLKEPIKKKVYKSISWAIGIILLASLAISTIKFNKTLFWL